MRDAAGELTDGFHLLRLSEPVLGLAGAGHVGDREDEVTGFFIRPLHRAAAQLGEHLAAVGALKGQLGHRFAFGGLSRRSQQRVTALVVLGLDETVQRH